MDSATQMDAFTVPKNKVELHVHLDGSVRISTLWELAKKKRALPEFKTEEDFRAAFTIETPSNLANFLKPFNLILPLISGDTQVLERIAYEFCEDASREGILYVETRYCPHLLTSSEVTPRDVVVAINEGLRKGGEEFRIKAKCILSCIRGRSEWSEEILNLCCEFKDHGVVGIDICGDQNAVVDTAQRDIAVFQRAASLGIHRTAHAGEDGPASQVYFSVHQLLAERIGHGYRSVDDQEVYRECLKKGIHFETCPTSSLLTGSVGSVEQRKHPIVRFAEDNANFSISRDDPTITQKTLEEEYSYLRSLGLNDMQLAQANLNAARSAFLPENEKKELLQHLRAAYGINDEN